MSEIILTHYLPSKDYLPDLYYTQDQIKRITKNLIENKYKSVDSAGGLFIEFFDLDQIFLAVVHIVSGKILEVEMESRKFPGGIGQRFTTKLKDVPEEIALKELKYYLTDTGTRKSLYKEDRELIIELAPFTEINNSNTLYSDNVSLKQNFMLSPYVSEDLNNNMALRCLDSNYIKYHLCKVPRIDIKKAINSLSSEHFALIYLIFLPETQIDTNIAEYDLKIELKNKFKKIRNKNRNGYFKVYRQAKQAIPALRTRVLDLQS